ncbi:MAG TPA: hypothetical protein VE968_08700 [Sphingomicrobium sp.]|nr:hypothetical protein [Sphingomicrobium sp.]
MSPAHEPNALAPVREREADEIMPRQPSVLGNRAERRNDRALADIDAAVKAFMARQRSRLDGETDRCRDRRCSNIGPLRGDDANV